MIETDTQKRLVDRIDELGGWAKKVSSQTAGWPDLGAVIPDYGPCFIEVKYLGDVGDKPFKRLVELTALQEQTLNDMNATHRGSGFVIVTYRRGRKLYAAFLNYFQSTVTGDDICLELSRPLEAQFPPLHSILRRLRMEQAGQLRPKGTPRRSTSTQTRPLSQPHADQATDRSTTTAASASSSRITSAPNPDISVSRSSKRKRSTTSRSRSAAS